MVAILCDKDAGDRLMKKEHWRSDYLWVIFFVTTAILLDFVGSYTTTGETQLFENGDIKVIDWNGTEAYTPSDTGCDGIYWGLSWHTAARCFLVIGGLMFLGFTHEYMKNNGNLAIFIPLCAVICTMFTFAVFQSCGIDAVFWHAVNSNESGSVGITIADRFEGLTRWFIAGVSSSLLGFVLAYAPITINHDWCRGDALHAALQQLRTEDCERDDIITGLVKEDRVSKDTIIKRQEDLLSHYERKQAPMMELDATKCRKPGNAKQFKIPPIMIPRPGRRLINRLVRAEATENGLRR